MAENFPPAIWAKMNSRQRKATLPPGVWDTMSVPERVAFLPKNRDRYLTIDQLKAGRTDLSDMEIHQYGVQLPERERKTTRQMLEKIGKDEIKKEIKRKIDEAVKAKLNQDKAGAQTANTNSHNFR